MIPLEKFSYQICRVTNLSELYRQCDVLIITGNGYVYYYDTDPYTADEMQGEYKSLGDFNKKVTMLSIKDFEAMYTRETRKSHIKFIKHFYPDTKFILIGEH